MPRNIKAEQWSQSDSSHWAYKLQLRQRFAEKVEARLCFDLFCGTGRLTSEVWAPRFDKVICVDSAKAQLDEFPQIENTVLYCGDNKRLLVGLLTKWGWPDVFDLDAYGWPDPLVYRILTSRQGRKPFVIIGTNGGCSSRRRGSTAAIPACWGYGKCSVAPFSAQMDACPVADFTHLREWAALGDKQITEFEEAHWGAMAYWAALVEPIPPRER